MNIILKITLITTLMLSSIAFPQAKGKEYGALKNRSGVDISHRKNSDNSIDFLYTKNKPGSYTVYYSFTNVRNTNFSDGVKKVILKNSSGTLFKLRASNPTKGIQYKSSYKVQQGIIDPKFDKGFIYLLPFAKGTPVKLLNGKKIDSFALEVTEKTNKVAFKFQTETPQVHASRKGEVVKIFSAFGKKTKISIEHIDGTLSKYSGFDISSIQVKEGQKILPGKHLGNLMKDTDGLFTLNFRVIYKTKIDGDYKTAYITPEFDIAEDNKTLEKNKTYRTSYTEDVFFQEFSKKAKKKYLKTKAGL